MNAAPGMRRMAIVPADETLRCPDGHRFRDPLVWDHGVLRCTQRTRDGTPCCNKTVYLVGGGLMSVQGEPFYVLAEVSNDEVAEMRRRRMRLPECIRFLGLDYLVFNDGPSEQRAMA